MVACDVGQGDMLLVRAGASAAVVIDTGPDDDAATGCLTRYGVTQVPLLVLSHPHADHDSATGAVADAVQVSAAWVAAPGEQASAAAALRARGVPVEVPGEGERIVAGDVTVDVLSSRHEDAAAANVNDASIATRLEATGVSVLALGDLEPGAQGEIARRVAPQEVDVVKIAHHGSAAQDAQARWTHHRHRRRHQRGHRQRLWPSGSRGARACTSRAWRRSRSPPPAATSSSRPCRAVASQRRVGGTWEPSAMAARTRSAEPTWHRAAPAPVVLVSGPESLLGQRAIERITATMKGAPVTRLDAGAYSRGALLAAASPSLFDDAGIVVVEGAEAMNDDFLQDALAYVAQPDPAVVVIIRHGGGVRGKKLLDTLRKGGAPEYTCPAVKKDAEIVDFARGEFERGKRPVSAAVVRSLVDAVGSDIAEVAAACQQAHE
ncbi:MBL fold metallo-hydrolase [Demequina litorisediminis]|uniref:MBL fold metallo-hydrolase n=1 Tax=Demequina litorisediminis TaxID=1849022 RepID=UPI0024E153CE|nr:MBL fold metallo-hydrolase [Demequina litorisediminis]